MHAKAQWHTTHGPDCAYRHGPLPKLLRTDLFLLLLGRVALVRGIMAYSCKTFPWTICRSVHGSCGKTADRIRMLFGIMDQTDPEMRQVVGFGDRSTEWVLLRANLGGAIVTNGDFTAYVCDSA